MNDPSSQPGIAILVRGYFWNFRISWIFTLLIREKPSLGKSIPSQEEKTTMDRSIPGQETFNQWHPRISEWWRWSLINIFNSLKTYNYIYSMYHTNQFPSSKSFCFWNIFSRIVRAWRRPRSNQKLYTCLHLDRKGFIPAFLAAVIHINFHSRRCTESWVITSTL